MCKTFVVCIKGYKIPKFRNQCCNMIFTLYQAVSGSNHTSSAHIAATLASYLQNKCFVQTIQLPLKIYSFLDQVYVIESIVLVRRETYVLHCILSIIFEIIMLDFEM